MSNMTTKILPVTDLRRRTSEIIAGIKENNETVYITQHGRPEVVLLDYEWYEELIAQFEQSKLQRKQHAATTLLQSWIDADDDGEQVETGDALQKGLDDNRMSDRPLFPDKLKGETW